MVKALTMNELLDASKEKMFAKSHNIDTLGSKGSVISVIFRNISY